MHRFRDTYVTDKVQEGIDLLTLRVWVGHENLETLKLYAQALRNKDERARAAANAQDRYTLRESGEPCILSIGHIIEGFQPTCQGYYVHWTECCIMSTWVGRKCGSPCATCAGTGGYRKLRTRQIAPRRNAVQHSGTRAALMAGRGKRGSRRGVAVRHLCESFDKVYRGQRRARITSTNSRFSNVATRDRSHYQNSSAAMSMGSHHFQKSTH